MKPFDMATYRALLGQDNSVTEQDLFLVLNKVQDTFGSVPRSVVEDLSARSGVPEARIWGALTAYRGFNVTEEE